MGLEVEGKERAANHPVPSQPKDAAVDGGVVVGTAAVKIVAEGKIIHRSTVDPLSLLMRVIHEEKYFICVDKIFEDRVYLNCNSLEDK